MLRTIWEYFRKDERGQDLAEYCLVTALIALVALGIFIHVSGGVSSLWGTANTTLEAGNASSGGGSTAATTGTSPTTAQHSHDDDDHRR